jgi:anthranilate synthase component II
MRILVFDNYDSFTYNLVHLLEKISGCDIEVHRNDKITLAEVDKFDKILISPGPGIPSEAGLLPQLLSQYASTKSILGVCLGHQAIAEAFGGSLVNLPKVFHGVATPAHVVVEDDELFTGLPATFRAGRYHSWAVDASTLPRELEVTAVDENGIIMAMRHASLNIKSVQFHPESVLTSHGEAIIRNWIERC